MAIKNYKRMKVILSVFFLLFSYLTVAQKGYEAEIEQFYKDLNNGNSGQLKSYFLPTASIVHLDNDTAIVLTVDDFLKGCPKFKSKQFREEIISIELVEWKTRTIRYKVHFNLYKDDKLVNCGIDEFNMIRLNTYDYFIDKIYSESLGCEDATSQENETKTELTEKINKIMNYWHLFATEADLESYFGIMHPEFIFLGTDPSERWTKKEFYDFCSPYFEAGKAWDFKVNWRNVYFSKDGKNSLV